MARVSSDTVPSTHAAKRGETRRDEARSWQARLRRYGYTPPPHASVRGRLVPPQPKPGRTPWSALGIEPRWRGWGGPLLVALFAGLLRFWQLGTPHAVIFDETYYAKDAWSLLQFGYEAQWGDNANDLILADNPTVPLSEDPSYVVHPPMGKWVIAIGLRLFGLEPFGWRFMVALLGTLSVLMLCRIGRRLFRSTALGCLAGGLLAVDGLHLVMSRTALLDLVLMFFVLAAFGALLVDRDRSRARLAAALPEDRPDPLIAATAKLGLRPWRLLAGVCLGLAVGTKWSGLYVLAAFGLLTVLWDVSARRTAGARRPYRAVLRRDAVPAFLSLVPVALVVYLASWTGWFATRGGYFRGWADNRRGLSPDEVTLPLLGRISLPQFDMTWVPAPLRSLWHYESEVYSFHRQLTSEHRYESNPWSWLVAGRPVSYHYNSRELGAEGCMEPSGCAREVLALGTPMLWWVGVAALVYALYRWVLRRDWRAGAILCGLAAGYLPWFLYQERTIFYFYAVVFVPFICLAVAMLLGAMAGPPGATEARRVVGLVVGGALVLLIVWNLVYFWPLYTAGELSVDEWRARMWFDTWI
ncbi:phospholipid carrier-dependent glycosyltransferase [Streptomyces durbertensis]|uniref:Polyprenol-phosphate-mannose--protein mannosyltransferase n=1 Tax=Streptomyces durbertensis TaxID=2448886 RepID=A0ABR6EAM7_9ACTN|nr:phospholipid carrier-dependent glycosyltransferase [Streptomyces durbertensis]MBB1242396.1 phospholipid carrier-dependent glycosyltransferase [Streptomyces durbertensis]